MSGAVGCGRASSWRREKGGQQWPAGSTADCQPANRCAHFYLTHHTNTRQSVLAAVKSSFAALSRRLASTAVGGALFLERPIFGVDLQLRVPAVVLSPSLDEIQEAINDTAKKVGEGRARGVGRGGGCLSGCTRVWPTGAGKRCRGVEDAVYCVPPACPPATTAAPPLSALQVLQVARQLRMWSAEDPGATYYDLLAADADVVKVVLLLTGSIQGMKAQTVEYLGEPVFWLDAVCGGCCFGVGCCCCGAGLGCPWLLPGWLKDTTFVELQRPLPLSHPLRRDLCRP